MIVQTAADLECQLICPVRAAFRGCQFEEGSIHAGRKFVPFDEHGAEHAVEVAGRPLRLFDSYHCSRYNTNTGRLTPEMFQSVFAAIRARLDESG